MRLNNRNESEEYNLRIELKLKFLKFLKNKVKTAASRVGKTNGRFRETKTVETDVLTLSFVLDCCLLATILHDGVKFPISSPLYQANAL
jgi:hypothetical protein